MRRLCTADWQLAAGDRDRYRLDFVIKALPELIAKYEPDQLLVLGDLTEEKDNHPASLVNEIVKAFGRLSNDCDIIILQGNHDFLHKGHPFFEFLGGFARIKWISSPTVLDNCLYLPHTREYKMDWRDVNMSGHDYIFAHNIFSGVQANGQKLSGIPTSVFPDGACVISGDVHEPQQFDVVTYVGAPFLCDFGDDYQPRVLLADDLKLKSIKVKGPQKRLLHIVWGENGFSSRGEANPGDIVKIQVHIGKEHVANWSEIRKSSMAWGNSSGFVVNTIQPIVSYVQGERVRPVQVQQKSDYQHLAAFVQRFGVDEKTAQTGKDLME